MNYDDLKADHLARLRALQRRYDCADAAGNEDGCAQIQNLIDQENERWSQHEAATQSTKTKK
jgi:hypothetical protein